MKISLKSALVKNIPTIIGGFLDKQIVLEGGREEKALAVELNKIAKAEEFKGEKGKSLYLPAGEFGGPIYLIGLGEEKKFTADIMAEAIGSAAKFLQTKSRAEYQVVLPVVAWKKIGSDELVSHLTLSVYRAAYHFHEYLTKEKNKKHLPKQIDIILPKGIKVGKLSEKVSEAQIIGEAINDARRLGNIPPIDMTPTYLAKTAEKLATENPKLKVEVLDRAGIKKEKMGALEAVALGSHEEPRFIVMEWLNGKKSDGTYVFAGKGVTFDSGGISIKPADGMDEMKFDMMGAAAVMGAMKAIVELKLKVNIVGLIPATENMSSNKAYRPGDIITAKNGTTIEVLNTDAEGRLILADALSYAQKYKPKAVIDLATLTGACCVALGTRYAGLFTRDEKLASVISKRSEETGELVWRLPLEDNFRELMESKVADVKNISGIKYGGASTGAAFLENFTDYTWAHLDIAPVMATDEKPDRYPGALGFGVHLLVALAKGWSKK